MLDAIYILLGVVFIWGCIVATYEKIKDLGIKKSCLYSLATILFFSTLFAGSWALTQGWQQTCLGISQDKDECEIHRELKLQENQCRKDNNYKCIKFIKGDEYERLRQAGLSLDTAQTLYLNCINIEINDCMDKRYLD